MMIQQTLTLETIATIATIKTSVIDLTVTHLTLLLGIKTANSITTEGITEGMGEGMTEIIMTEIIMTEITAGMMREETIATMVMGMDTTETTTEGV